MSVNNKLNQDSDDSSAVKMVRGRIEALFKQFQKDNLSDAGHQDSSWSKKIAEFWGKHHSHPNPHQAWQDYYNALTPAEQHVLWEEYHLHVGRLSGVPQSTAETDKLQSGVLKSIRPAVAKRLKQQIEKGEDGRLKRLIKQHVMPIVLAGIISSSVWLVFNNELVIANIRQYVAPGTSSISPIIIDPSAVVTSDPRIIIPKINVDVPVVYGITGFNENDIQSGLERGVVHYGDTALPGQRGNAVIVGHSSNNFFNLGQYKFAFVLLNKLEVGDTFMIHYEGTRYVYRVNLKRVIAPSDFSLIQPTPTPTATLITCDPPGSSRSRMVIQGEQISPDPSIATQAPTGGINPNDDAIVPGNAQSLWSRFLNFLF